MKNLKYAIILGLVFTFGCKEDTESKKFEEEQEEDCGCDDVDTTEVAD